MVTNSLDHNSVYLTGRQKKLLIALHITNILHGHFSINYVMVLTCTVTYTGDINSVVNPSEEIIPDETLPSNGRPDQNIHSYNRDLLLKLSSSKHCILRRSVRKRLFRIKLWRGMTCKNIYYKKFL